MMKLHEHGVVPSHGSAVVSLRHCRLVPSLQQRLVGEQVWPAAGHVAPGWQVPEVAPAGMLQDRPEQQSPLTVQAPFCGTHSCGASQVPALQIPEQQSALVEQLVPLELHPPPASGVEPGSWQAKVSSEVLRHSEPAQQELAPPSCAAGSQLVPSERHCGTVHRCTPLRRR
jgi:hypothetical protein